MFLLLLDKSGQKQHVLSYLVQLKSVLFNLWCVLDLFFQERWQSTLFQMIIIIVIVIDPRREAPQWGAAEAKIKVPSGENTELKRSFFEAWSRSVYSHSCYAYCKGVLPCLFLPFRSIHLHFFQNLSQFFSCWPAE